ncbi:hypothetical protein PCIT_a1871 [Pseudoalteromonas citrea]|uniref:Uncharacterized protein n=2 Tax=Pseudoalteromonas citrea TaxID=43655 RepID=A0AAD4FS44_9GAMM|nr:hypothetical protein [Pseudoalteromonas citrea]KAF7771909.1 hypothetical protein PCIT_a1871 [Pseudoalteromonas citrea]
MHHQEVTFESQGGFKVMQLIWLGLLVIVMLSLAISSFIMNQQVWYFNVLSLCMMGILLRMGYMNYRCCQYFNTRLVVKNNTLYRHTGLTETHYQLHDVTCSECAVSNVYKLTNAQGQIIAYLNGFLPNSKKLTNKILAAAKE